MISFVLTAVESFFRSVPTSPFLLPQSERGPALGGEAVASHSAFIFRGARPPTVNARVQLRVAAAHEHKAEISRRVSGVEATDG